MNDLLGVISLSFIVLLLGNQHVRANQKEEDPLKKERVSSAKKKTLPEKTHLLKSFQPIQKKGMPLKKDKHVSLSRDVPQENKKNIAILNDIIMSKDPSLVHNTEVYSFINDMITGATSEELKPLLDKCEHYINYRDQFLLFLIKDKEITKRFHSLVVQENKLHPHPPPYPLFEATLVEILENE